MLEIDPSKRISINEIHKMLDNFWKNTGEPGESLGINEKQQNMITSVDKANCVFYNMPTINSNQK